MSTRGCGTSKRAKNQKKKSGGSSKRGKKGGMSQSPKRTTTSSRRKDNRKSERQKKNGGGSRNIKILITSNDPVSPDRSGRKSVQKSLSKRLSMRVEVQKEQKDSPQLAGGNGQKPAAQNNSKEPQKEPQKEEDREREEITIKILKKFKKKRRFEIVPKSNYKTFYQLDQKTNNNRSIVVPIGQKSDKKMSAEQCKTAVIKVKSIPKAVDQKGPVEVMEDSYDHHPKIDEILKLEPEDIYKNNSNPEWMIQIEPEEEDLKDIEPVCTVGSEQIEMYQNKQFVLHSPPTNKILELDPFEKLCILKARDDEYSTPPLVFSNTIRSLINMAGLKNSIKKPVKTSRNPGENAIVIVEIDRDRDCFLYSRSDPISSVSQKVRMKREDVPMRQDLSIYINQLQQI
ncbi:unnamed protein product [Caenorhabditis angaria]|uniref:Uncharacterized protein n=1 Tax=Caenorhabditis angaria TaxID=860376 RepID=A0A9P1ILP1_9PELO|nr:unnamed protein product [Caenorhabditis angaria]